MREGWWRGKSERWRRGKVLIRLGHNEKCHRVSNGPRLANVAKVAKGSPFSWKWECQATRPIGGSTCINCWVVSFWLRRLTGGFEIERIVKGIICGRPRQDRKRYFPLYFILKEIQHTLSIEFLASWLSMQEDGAFYIWETLLYSESYLILCTKKGATNKGSANFNHTLMVSGLIIV